MNASGLTDEYINGTIDLTLTGKITGIIRGPGWREIQIDPGLPGESLVQLRVTDSDPIDVDATQGEPELVAPGESFDPNTSEPISDPQGT